MANGNAGFISHNEKSRIYAPGYFLADTENFVSVTKQMKQNGDSGSVTVKDTEDGGKYVPMGSIYKEGETAVGIVYEDVDVTNGDMPGAVVISGVVYEDRLAEGTAEELTSVSAINIIKKGE